MTKQKHFYICLTILDSIGSAKDRRKTFLPLPILVAQICKEWMSDVEFNLAMHERVKIMIESISSSYQASLQIDWTPAILQEHVVIAFSSSSESKDEDDEFFEQEPLEENKAFMALIWKGIKRTYRKIKGKKKKKKASQFMRTRSEGGSSRGKRGRHT